MAKPKTVREIITKYGLGRPFVDGAKAGSDNLLLHIEKPGPLGWTPEMTDRTYAFIRSLGLYEPICLSVTKTSTKTLLVSGHSTGLHLGSMPNKDPEMRLGLFGWCGQLLSIVGEEDAYFFQQIANYLDSKRKTRKARREARREKKSRG